MSEKKADELIGFNRRENRKKKGFDRNEEYFFDLYPSF